MSSPKSEISPSVVAQKPRSNVYTVMLFVSLIAILTACILLYLELRRFGSFPYWKTPPANVMAAPYVAGQVHV